MYFSINCADNDQKLFNSLKLESHEFESNYESQISNSLPLAINYVNTKDFEQTDLKENTTVSLIILL